MDVWIFTLLNDEVLWQTRMALTAANDMEAALEANDSASSKADELHAQHRFWCATQTFLSASANLSKLLVTPRDGEAADEREFLRKKLHLPHDSPLLDRELRNHFEHYDSRIIKLARQHPDAGSTDALFGHPDEYGPYAHHILRCFDPQEQKFWFHGKPFPLRPWVEALRDVRALAQETRPY